jgi:hypothetical protein
MMLIATGVAAALLASAVPAPSTASLPPVIVHVFTVPGVPGSLVSRVLDETDEIWRASAVAFLWHRAARDAAAKVHPADTAPAPYPPSTLRVVIGDEAGAARDHRTPLGWIVFDDEQTPQREIYLSYANAKVLMEASRAFVGGIERMPRLQRELLLARAMGRALAHELGHYLLASKVHPADTAPKPYPPSTLRVVIGDEAGVARDHRTPLGWIVFDDEQTPQREIYLSYANAKVLMEASRAFVGGIERMPRLQRELLLARAMGRALAHELGHYLLASKVHTKHGLLKASRTASELFAAERSGFQLDPSQRHLIASRLRGDSFVASR